MNEPKEQAGRKAPLTRIFIDEKGDLTVTDLWEPVRRLLDRVSENPVAAPVCPLPKERP